MVFQILNKLKWTHQLQESEITILHRGGKDNRKVIHGKDITEVKKSYFLYQKGGKETFIPNHRIVEIKRKNKIVWERNVPQKR